MRFSTVSGLVAALSLACASNAARILLNNDDGFGSGNTRELYRLLKEAGHEVVIVAPATQQSGQGGLTEFTTEANLTAPSQYDIVPAGAPSVGTDPNDSNIWYYNGTPAACTFVGLDYVIPRYYKDWKYGPDVFVAGPNFGVNLGPFVFTLSGTIGSTYAAVSRSVPGIAISASNDRIAYSDVKNTSNPATWTAKASFKVVQEFIESTPEGQSVLPLGYGVNVNIPPLDNDEEPPIYQTRLTGEADTDIAAYDEETGLFDWDFALPKPAGVNACWNGDCSLPGETWIVNGGGVSVSLFTVDYDAPTNVYTTDVFGKVSALFEGPKGNGTSAGSKKLKRGLARPIIKRHQ
ncbi:sure-like protein [Aaosphaeria arxii CBS 175.79]|uniref:Sure-like protein n=1 Tax=Aaosphaeria arxii CBS 175.79 TaxID=1450172 RepID=A0A6A5Y4V7_9PLEO|nr:sure-like protein [Aaosphaeria arxii CBS 175.79]KAF2019881.1 sure-like protein [Aaosphaeria arxii CBS 175.79]